MGLARKKCLILERWRKRKQAIQAQGTSVSKSLKVGHAGVLGFICLECRPSELVVGDEARVGNLGWIQWLGVPVGDKELMEGLREKRNTKQWRKFLSC